jgi:hypothetical protein
MVTKTRCDSIRRNSIKKGAEFFKGFRILRKDFDRRNLEQVIHVASWCSNNMKTPRMMHYVVEIEEEEIFNSRRFTQNLKEKFASEIKAYNKERALEGKNQKAIPSMHVVFSIESKYLKPSSPVPYLHIHVLVFIDTLHNLYGFDELNICINKALSKVHGLEALWFNKENKGFYKDNKRMYLGFFKKRERMTLIKVGDIKCWQWHDLKTELEDAICRASYLCKLDQKDLLPDEFKRGNSFGHTRPPKNNSQDYARLKNIPINTQLGFF